MIPKSLQVINSVDGYKKTTVVNGNGNGAVLRHLILQNLPGLFRVNTKLSQKSPTPSDLGQ